MAGYSLLLDESYDESTDVFVVAGVIIESDRLALLADAVAAVAELLTGDGRAEVKYADDPVFRGLLAGKKKTIGNARWAMSTVPKTIGGITIVASIIIDPTADPKAGYLPPLRWGFQRCITHYINFLSDLGPAPGIGVHAVIADQFPRKHESEFHAAYRDQFDRRPFGNTPHQVGMQRWLHEVDATDCAPMQLADHVAGAVRAWTIAEKRLDLRPGPTTGKATAGPRNLMRQYIPRFRSAPWNPNKKSGYGVSIWPEACRPQLDLWLARTRGERVDELFVPVHMDISARQDGERVLRIDPGTKRTYE